ncbi:hypothetical protein VTK56DRAFT_5837 [Thermocarpiscus australiensis]
MTESNSQPESPGGPGPSQRPAATQSATAQPTTRRPLTVSHPLSPQGRFPHQPHCASTPILAGYPYLRLTIEPPPPLTVEVGTPVRPMVATLLGARPDVRYRAYIRLHNGPRTEQPGPVRYCYGPFGSFVEPYGRRSTTSGGSGGEEEEGGGGGGGGGDACDVQVMIENVAFLEEGRWHYEIWAGTDRGRWIAPDRARFRGFSAVPIISVARHPLWGLPNDLGAEGKVYLEYARGLRDGTVSVSWVEFAEEYNRLIERSSSTNGPISILVVRSVVDLPTLLDRLTDKGRQRDEDEENEEEGHDKPEKRDKKKVPCDGGKTCLCNKPAAEHPDHVWKLSAAGKYRFFMQRIHSELRCPDNFNMYTFNDHEGYGVLEVLQNLILDFEEPAGNYKEQWAICEALAFFLHTDTGLSATQIDDGSYVDATYEVIGRLFMTMLAILEREKLLGKDSEIKNLGLIMALFMDIAADARRYGLLEVDEKEPLGPAEDNKEWIPHAFDNQILAYARKYGIDLVGPSHIAEIIAEAKGDGTLPVPDSEPNSTRTGNPYGADPFNFYDAMQTYKLEFGGVTAMLAGTSKKTNSIIGGDNLDITSWSSAERKRKSYDGKDPLRKKEIDALKQGLVLTMG